MTGISDDDLEQERATRLQTKTRPKGTLPYLPTTSDIEVLREFLSLALRPREGWRVWEFERAGRQKTDPCSLVVRNGREVQTHRFKHQGELYGRDVRSVVVAVTDGELRPPHLTGGEIEDLWAALCILGTVASEYDDRDEARKWIEQLLTACQVFTGHTLIPDARHDALMALKAHGEFTRPDALSMLRGGDPQWQRRPVRVIDRVTGEQYVRAGEAATFVRYVLGAEPLSPPDLQGAA